MTSWKFYLSPSEAEEAMYQTCAKAKVSIDFEQYIFENDSLGRKFLELFMQKAAAGVHVRLLCDAVGSNSLYSSAALTDVRRSGVRVEFFNRIRPYWRWVHRILEKFLRTHRKLLIVDGRYGLIGGVGIRANKLERRDTHVRVTGPVVAEIASAFDRMWRMAARGKRLFKFYKPIMMADGFTLLTNSPRFHQRFTYHALVKMFRSARKYIYLTTPYFVPDGRLFRALKGAARRGVDVRLIVPNSPDWKMVRFANSSYYARALRAGIRIFEYGPEFIHAKTSVVDDSWACVGSSNLDSLSLLLNYEADLSGTNKDFVAELKLQFLRDLDETKEVIRRVWRRRSFAHKLLEFLVLPLHRIL